MDETTHRELTDRLDRLEEECSRLRRNGRRWKGLGACAALLAGVFVCVPAQGDGPDEVSATKVTANSIRLRGPKGKLRAMLSVTRRGTAALSLLDAGQKVRSMITVGAKGGQNLTYLNKAGKVVMTLSVGGSGDPVLTMSDPTGANTRLSLTSQPAALLCNDKAGQPRGLIGVNKAGSGVFELKDATGATIK